MMDYVLALFDIRAKQKFIYRSNKIKEIVGGSWLIRDLFDDYLYAAASMETGVEGEKPLGKIKKYTAGDKFSHEKFEKELASGEYCGEVIYNGGGNLLVLFKNEDVCREVYRRFTRKVLKVIPTLNVACTWQKVSSWDNYHQEPGKGQGDYEALYAKHRFAENQELQADPYWTVPMVQVDYTTSMPLTSFKTVAKEGMKLTTEQNEKYNKFERIKYRYENSKDNKDTLILTDIQKLDEMVEKKGENSLLAIVYADGNNIGAKYSSAIEGKSGYDECINELREKSSELQKVFIDDTLAKVDEVFSEKLYKRTDKGMQKIHRFVIYSGDEINIILPAKLALPFVRTYLNVMDENYHSCAGIAVFHSHAPFADVYRIAEQCCENAKKLGKDINKKDQENSLIDFQYCRAAIGVDLDQIRKDEHMKDLSRPWFVNDIDKENLNGVTSLEQADQMASVLNQFFGRSNVKGLIDLDIVSEEQFEMEIRRITAHMSEEKRNRLKKALNNQDVYEYFKANRKMIQDIVEFYDIWFAEGDEQE